MAGEPKSVGPAAKATGLHNAAMAASRRAFFTQPLRLKLFRQEMADVKFRRLKPLEGRDVSRSADNSGKLGAYNRDDSQEQQRDDDHYFIA
jgi:hypothetical protein